MRSSGIRYSSSTNRRSPTNQHVAFTRRLGPLQMTMVSDPYGGGGPINRFSNLDENGELIPPDDDRSLYQAGNTLWHSDGAFKRVPLRASLLSAKVVPPEGGETEYASLRAAYAALPERKKAELEGLVAEHSMGLLARSDRANLMSEAWLKETPPVRHILVRTIPRRERKALFVGAYASHIVGWPLEKAGLLVEELLEWSTQRPFVYQHEWQADDLVIWTTVRACTGGDRGTAERMHALCTAPRWPAMGQQCD